MLLVFGAWTGAAAATEVRDPLNPLDGVIGGVLFASQTAPSLILAAIAALAALLAVRVRALGFVADLAVGLGALATLSFGALITLVAVPVAIPFLATGFGLLATLALSHWPTAPDMTGPT